jgi:regulator of sigma E protease
MNFILGVVLVLGLMILVHEWGHFVVARIFGVRVDVFSIGFGPRLFGWKRGATDYRVSALPLGGYVRMAGQDPSEIDSSDHNWTGSGTKETKASVVSDVAHTAAEIALLHPTRDRVEGWQAKEPDALSNATRDVAKFRGVDQALRTGSGAQDELMSKPRWQRALISFAGPAVNLLFPIFLLTGLYAAVGIPYPAWVDGHVSVVGMPDTAAAKESPLRVGDKLVAIDGVQNPTWEQTFTALKQAPAGGTVKMTVENGGEQRNVEVVLKDGMKADDLLGYAPVLAVLEQVGHGSPAERAGLRENDAIVGVDGQKIKYWEQFVERVKGSNGKTLKLDVTRKGQQLQVSVTPQMGPNQAGENIYQIGVAGQEDIAYKRASFPQGVREAGAMTLARTEETVGVVGMLVSGRVSVRQLQGAVGISRAAGDAVKKGPIDVIFLMVLISVNLGVLNLLPIPILDGGNILLLSIEGIMRRDLSMAFKERFVQVGLVFLLVLFAIVMYNDVARLFPIRS